MNQALACENSRQSTQLRTSKSNFAALDRHWKSWPDADKAKYKSLGYWQNKSLASILWRRAQQQPNLKAVIDGDTVIHYGELQQSVDQLSQGLQNLGLIAGDCAVIQLENGVEFFQVFFACLQTGVIPVLALPAHRALELEYFCKHVGARILFSAGKNNSFDYEAQAQKIKQQCHAIEHIITSGGDTPSPPSRDSGLHTLKSLLASQLPIITDKHSGLSRLKSSSDFYDVDPDQLAFFQLSGGTTGTPKLIPRTHNDYLYSIRASANICGLMHTSVFLSTLPLAHNFPLSSPGSLGTFHAGGSVVIAKSGDPEHCFNLIKKHSVTITALVPPLAVTWLNALNRHQHPNHENPIDLSSLELMQVGGAKLNEEIAQALPKQFNCRLQQVFGMAEGLVNYTRVLDPKEWISGTQGRPTSPHDDLKIVNDLDQPLALGETGHLITRGPYTICSYFKSEQANRNNFTVDGYYRTGDIARLTSDGNIVVEGRSKDQINRGGEKISCPEIENYLLKHSDVNDCALVSISDSFLGERSCAFIVSSKPLSKKTLFKHLLDLEIAQYKFPDHYLFVDSLEKTKLGKVSKKDLRATAEAALNKP